MTNENEEGKGESTTWKSARDRIVRFAGNLLNLEKTIDRLVRNQGQHRTAIKDLDDRLRRIEAQQEIIIRLLERDRRN